MLKKFIENVSLIKRGVRMLFKIEKPYTILLIVTSIISVCPELFKHLFHGKNSGRIGRREKSEPYCPLRAD